MCQKLCHHYHTYALLKQACANRRYHPYHTYALLSHSQVALPASSGSGVGADWGGCQLKPGSSYSVGTQVYQGTLLTRDGRTKGTEQKERKTTAGMACRIARGTRAMPCNANGACSACTFITCCRSTCKILHRLSPGCTLCLGRWTRMMAVPCRAGQRRTR